MKPNQRIWEIKKEIEINEEYKLNDPSDYLFNLIVAITKYLDEEYEKRERGKKIIKKGRG